jgi:DNA-binding NtrC family response regulator
MKEEPETGGAKTILLVEDDPKLTQMITETMSDNFGDKVKVISFSTGGLAVEYLEQNIDDVHLIITCRLLHKGNGVEMLKSCKKMSPTLPVILHTALVCKDKFSPFDACIEKQSGFSPLMTAISELLRI